MEETPKKGMSKGCTISLVIGIVVVVMIIVGGWYLWSKKDELVKQGMIFTVNTLKTQINDNPIEGIDLDAFNEVADGFVQRFELEESFDAVKIQAMAQTIQRVANNLENPDVATVEALQAALISYYPDLGELVPEKIETDILDDGAEVIEEAPATE